MKVAFFARVVDRDVFETVNFYSQDIRALRELGHDVVLCRRFSEIPRDCDMYFTWWWSWAFLPMLRAVARRSPLVITGVFDYDTAHVTGGSYLGRPFHERLVMRQMLARADANIFISEYEFNLMREAFDPPGCHLVPVGVDTDLYRPDPAAGREPFLLNVAWSGRHNGVRKCLLEIIEAFAMVLPEHPGLRLLMAGRQGDYHPTLVAAAHRLGVESAVDFLGVISEATKIRLMQTCAAYLQPTLWEGFGLAIAEAMACGAPVVTNNAGATTEVVAGTGFLAPSPTPPLIADQVARVLAAPERALSIGQAGSAQIRNRYPYSARRDGLARVLERTMTNGRRPAAT